MHVHRLCFLLSPVLVLVVGCGEPASPSESGTDPAGSDASTHTLPVEMPEPVAPEFVAGVRPTPVSQGCTVVVNEIQTRGATALDEFIELRASCETELDLTGFKLTYRAADGTMEFLRAKLDGLKIGGANPYLVAGNVRYTGTAAVRFADGLREDGGAIAVRGPGGTLLDSVGWGNATNRIVERTAAPVAPSGMSLARTPDGKDTDENAADFTLRAPTPGGPNG